MEAFELAKKKKDLIVDEGYLFNIGENYRAYNYLGNHRNPDQSVTFRVYAPNAQNVFLAGDFSNYENLQMEKNNNTGIWEITTKANEYDTYRYRVIQHDGKYVEKSDPFAFFSEHRPKSASFVYEIKDFDWTDASYIKKRRMRKPEINPMNIYEVNIASWMKHPDGRFYSYREFADRIVPYMKDMNYTHLELMPIMEHPSDESWGYQITGYYSITSRFGNPDDFRYLINLCHENDIAVILDWVPSHFVTDSHGLIYFDGTATFESPDYGRAFNKEWGTMQFDYARSEVISFLISNAMFYLDKYHVDGFRVDAVSSMIYLDFSNKNFTPNIYGGNGNLEAIDFLQKLNKVVKKNYEGIVMIAEESTDYNMVTGAVEDGGLGFDFKWNMGWMNDILRYIAMDYDHRVLNQKLANFSFIYAFNEKYIMPFSHDEVVHGKKSLLEKHPGDDYKKFQGLRALISFMYAHPGKKLNFMTNDIAQRMEWRYYSELEWIGLTNPMHNGIHHLFRELGKIYAQYPAMYELDCDRSGTQVLNSQNEKLLIKLIRKSKKKKEFVVTVTNFSLNEYKEERIAVPYEGEYKLILNTESVEFGGTWTENINFYKTNKGETDGMPYYITAIVPSLSSLYFIPSKLKGDRKK